MSLPIWRGRIAALSLAVLLAACGGGGGGDSNETPQGQPSAPEMPADRVAASRFLSQSTFGATDDQVNRVMSVGYGAWIDEQIAKPQTSHRTEWESVDAANKVNDPNSGAWQDDTTNAWWKAALTGDDQLRQRVAYALSQIFVISMVDNGVGDNPRGVAAYVDMLGTHAFGNYRTLLEQVSLHPLMGTYLSHMRNQKADARTGRVPDENYAREVMQLFSIGLVELNADGTPRQASGQAVDAYGQNDIAGLARVFTGWSWSCPDWPDNSCFFWGSANNSSDPDRSFKSMLGYPQYHSTEAKTFLGSTIAAQTQSDPRASLKAALDTLAAHPNVGPFIGKQLIQRLVTSNPSPAYVRAVAAAFDNNGAGVRGDLAAVVKAILMHPEARQVTDTSGKLREPVLRMTALLRAFKFTSDSGRFRVGNTDNPASSLGQTPLRSPSVFNFYRPGYVPPGTQAAARALAAPEMQIVHETTAAGTVNFFRDVMSSGAGQWNNQTNRRDLQPDFAAELAVADQPGVLVDQVASKLLTTALQAALKTEIQTAVTSIAIPTANANNANQVAQAKRNRVNAAVLLMLVSPEFNVVP
ncbi:MAG: DUF1800 family protein [Aquabacterium sp.]